MLTTEELKRVAKPGEVWQSNKTAILRFNHNGSVDCIPSSGGRNSAYWVTVSAIDWCDESTRWHRLTSLPELGEPIDWRDVKYRDKDVIVETVDGRLCGGFISRNSDMRWNDTMCSNGYGYADDGHGDAVTIARVYLHPVPASSFTVPVPLVDREAIKELLPTLSEEQARRVLEIAKE